MGGENKMKSFGDWFNDMTNSIDDASTVGETIKNESNKVDSIAEEWYDFDTDAFKADVEERIQRAKNIADAKGYLTNKPVLPSSPAGTGLTTKGFIVTGTDDGVKVDPLKSSGQAAVDWANNKDDSLLDLDDNPYNDDYDWVDDGN